MSNNLINITAPLYDYMLDVSLREDPLLKQLRDETAKDEMARMQISPDQGQFFALLVRLMGAKKTLEVGTFTGYSALAVARAMPDDSMTIACDVSEQWTTIARKYWKAAGVDHKIHLYLQPATETLIQLIKNQEQATFDFAFIDADKVNYDQYYEAALVLLKQNGLLVIDNVLWGGSVIDATVMDADTQSIRKLNEKIKQDMRVDMSMIAVADGLTLVRKR